ncbi:MAG: hypothetical protein EBQ92_00705, partial [Proteobacteria bacterium]|nr:hypothetical protein [Pseudomonadota bacterium]
MAAENEISLTDIAAFLPESIRIESAKPATEEEEPTAEKPEATEDSGNDDTAPSVQEEASTTDEEKQEEDSKEGEESSDEEDDDAEEADGEDTEKGEARSPKAEKLLKRIDKLTAKRREAEEALEKTREEAEKLRTELAAASKVVLQPTPEDPLTDVESIEDLDARIATAKRVRTWAMTHRDGATVKGADGSEEYVDAAEMARHLAAADAIVTDHGPARRAWLAQRETSRAEAQAAYPAFFTQGSAESKALRDILKQYPALGKYPNVELIIGDALVGQQARMARQEAQAKAKAPSRFPLPEGAVTRAGASEGDRQVEDPRQERTRRRGATESFGGWRPGLGRSPHGITPRI